MPLSRSKPTRKNPLLSDSEDIKNDQPLDTNEINILTNKIEDSNKKI